jgi:phage terminase large subunit
VEAEFPEKLQFLFEPARYKIAWGGRGSGKSWGVARALLILGTIRPLRILCAREVQRSLRESVHQLLKDQIASLGLGDHYRILDTEIRGARNQTLFMYAGLQGHTVQSIKSYEGIDIVWIEEGHSVKKGSWDILIPTIRKPGSEIWITMNTELASDYTHKAFVLNPPPDAAVVQMNYSDNPWFSNELEAERAHAEANSDPEDYKNIWLGEPRGAVSGAIYGKQIAIMDKLGRIGKVDVRPNLPVNSFWDLGSSTGNATAIWLHQLYGAADHFIKYISDTGRGMRYFWDELEKFRELHKFTWGVFYLPHDGSANMQGAELSNRVAILESLAEEKYAKKHGPIEVIPVPRVSNLGAAIDMTREKMTSAYIDAIECADGVLALRNYKYEWIEAAQMWSRTPHHDWASNGADAFRQWAQGYSPAGPTPGEIMLGRETGVTTVRGAY